uniref:Gpm519 n=1 Tax=Arundo donax TaxID=35708 RepID=A0A0A9DGK2_ARUDO
MQFGLNWSSPCGSKQDCQLFELFRRMVAFCRKINLLFPSVLTIQLPVRNRMQSISLCNART